MDHIWGGRCVRRDSIVWHATSGHFVVSWWMDDDEDDDDGGMGLLAARGWQWDNAVENMHVG